MSAKAKAAGAVVEEVVEVVEETVETLERIPRFALNGTTRNQQILILSFTALSGAAAATAVCFTVFKKRFESKYEKISEQEIAEAREFYAAINKPNLQDAVDEYIPESKLDASIVEAASALRGYGGHDLTPRGPVEEVVSNNIFVDGKPVDDNFDYEAEVAARSIDAPYIISKDEYNQAEKDYDQIELTYYEGDDTLCDAKDIIPDPDDVVGDMNLHRFGHGSGDNNVLYVRNDAREEDYVVLKSTGEYAKEVLGLRHSDRGGSRKQPRARWGDDE